MKKISALICALLAAFLLVSCGGIAGDEASVPGIDAKIIGTWKYESYSEYRDYITTLITDPDVYYDVYYIFNADGTGETYMSSSDAKRTFTYTFEGTTLTITSDGESFDTKCVLDGDKLTVHDDASDQNLVFERQ